MSPAILHELEQDSMADVYSYEELAMRRIAAQRADALSQDDNPPRMSIEEHIANTDELLEKMRCLFVR
jgi:hypothetical protein